ncbi:ATP-binding protein [Sandarakinorhabdus sp.]|uniref:sensor histidine kinase n=1 Tax=Sandarakinorhabdus sp. TaxID=1916663 RepID=UPI00286D760B|nr:ATP-binding protein [Sandarakinorhabdus sp.]
MTTVLASEIAVLLLAALLFGIVIGRLTRPDDPPALKLADPPAPAPAPANLVSIDALNDPAIIAQGSVVRAANAAARQLFGERFEGRDLTLTVRHPILLDALDEARRTGFAAPREITGLGSGASNSVWRVQMAAAGDNLTLILFDDITQTRLTERMRVDFVANASHELRTPLATLSGFIETLQGPAAEDEPARARFLGIMALEAERMSRLIDDLLSLSRIEIDKYVRPVSTISLSGIFGEVGSALHVRLAADDRKLIVEEAPDLPDVIADRDQILQVLHNLVSNALKYGQSGSPIHVAIHPEPAPPGQPQLVRISVSDQGEGIPAEHLPRLTERFYRVDSQRSRTMGGTGLGLAIVKHIVERHRGRLEIESRQGVGTKVSFTLPQAPRQNPIRAPNIVI